METGKFIISLVGIVMSCLVVMTSVIVYIINLKGDMRVYQERLKASEVLVEHLIQEGIKFKDKQHVFDNTLTKIDSWQGETTRTIDSWRTESKKEFLEIKDAIKHLAA